MKKISKLEKAVSRIIANLIVAGIVYYIAKANLAMGLAFAVYTLSTQIGNVLENTKHKCGACWGTVIEDAPQDLEFGQDNQ